MICPICYQDTDNDILYHHKCSRKLFSTTEPPLLPYKLNDMNLLAEKIVRTSMTVTGVQPKLSLTIEKPGKKTHRLTLVGLWGDYILKPPFMEYPELPENESITMMIAQYFGLKTVPHGLIYLESGELSYITKRVDRVNGIKLSMEDMCQLSERLTEDKYKGSVEQIAKIISKFSTNPGFDIISLYEIILFSFITGNADMHLKNFSLISDLKGAVSLAPAYDLVSTYLVIPDDKEESALTVNGKKSGLTIDDFMALAGNFGIPEKAALSSLRRMQNSIGGFIKLINLSYLSDLMKDKYISLVKNRSERISL